MELNKETILNHWLKHPKTLEKEYGSSFHDLVHQARIHTRFLIELVEQRAKEIELWEQKSQVQATHVDLLKGEIGQLRNEIAAKDILIESQNELLKLAQYIMSFHTMRCPMDIDRNFSGSEEHLAMYRDIRDLLEPYKGQIDWDKWHAGAMDRIKVSNEKPLSHMQKGEPHEANR